MFPGTDLIDELETRKVQPPPKCIMLFKILYTNLYIYLNSNSSFFCPNLTNFSVKNCVNYTTVMELDQNKFGMHILTAKPTIPDINQPINHKM